MNKITDSLQQHILIIASAILRSEKNGLNIQTMPPLCTSFRYGEDKTLQTIGMKALYPTYEEYLAALKQNDFESWTRRSKSLFGNNLDYVGFCYISSLPQTDGNRENKIVLSVVDSKDSCLSLVLPARDKIFEDDNIAAFHEIYVGYQNDIIPFYGNFYDSVH